MSAEAIFRAANLCVVGNLNQMAMQSMEWPGPDVYFDLLQFPPLLIPRYAFMVRPKDGVAPLSRRR